MISIVDAWKKIAENSSNLGSEAVSLQQVNGRRLACDSKTDVDSPPYDKSLMDGYAVRSSDLTRLPVTLKILETVTAGGLPKQTVREGTATRIMTGAPIPAGADAVVMVELTESSSSESTVTVKSGTFPSGTHIMGLGQCMRQGETIFHQGHKVRPNDVGLLAEIGCSVVTVYRRPKIAILSTGNELTPCNVVPSPGRIRNSNGPMLASLAANFADSVIDLGIAPDQLERLVDRMESGEPSDILIISGGVSEGLVDLVPRALQTIGFVEVFHKVAIKPGKPIWFGVHRQSGKLAFGLPGNPVSSLCCFEVFVRLAIDRMSGAAESERHMRNGILGAAQSIRGARPTYWPCRSTIDHTGVTIVTPLVWHGSSDLRCLAEANCFAYFPPQERPYPPESIVSILPIDE